jgi:multidrug transporter EmrE-like cation transporter
VLLPSVVAFTGFALTTLLLAKVVEVIPTSITYTVWTGSGTVAVSLPGVALFGDRLPPLAWAGTALVVVGVALVNLPGDRRPATSRSRTPWSCPVSKRRCPGAPLRPASRVRLGP